MATKYESKGLTEMDILFTKGVRLMLDSVLEIEGSASKDLVWRVHPDRYVYIGNLTFRIGKVVYEMGDVTRGPTFGGTLESFEADSREKIEELIYDAFAELESNLHGTGSG